MRTKGLTGYGIKIPRPNTPMPGDKRFRYRLWWLLETRGESAKTLARESDIDVVEKTLYTYLSGRAEPRASTIVQIAKHYGVTTDFLLGLSDDPKRVPYLN